MKSGLLFIYDFLHSHRSWLWAGLIILLLPLLIMAATLRYNEDIMDFLPITEEERAYLNTYQSRQSASRIVLIVEGDDERDEVIEECEERVPETLVEPDMNEQLASLGGFMPYLISDSVYAQMDSLLSAKAISDALQRDRLILSTPGTSGIAGVIQFDPLGWADWSGFDLQPANSNRSYAFYDSPYGSTETQHNAALVDTLQTIADELAEEHPTLNIRWIGAPIVAVGNAQRIKTDTLLCISLSVVLIVMLLAYAFPRKRDILLILLAVSFGWLVGMAALRIFASTVSAVVLGIGSVLIGIAVNYPLHMLVHQRYTTSVRQTLDEVLSPLVVGNITTVGAFLTLLPLQSMALRQLGLFAASMLVGTIFFCVFIMPHLMTAELTPVREIKIAGFTSPNSHRRVIQWMIIVLTFVAGIYLTHNRENDLFDSNLSHINYMTPQQRADLAYFDSIANPQHIIENNAYKAELWNSYWQSHSADSVIEQVQAEAEVAGFKPEAFAPFYHCLSEWKPLESFSMGDIAKRLSDDFDYIGLCCSIIVFFFLWLSFRNIWLAFIAFVPMALSWVWIMSIMHLVGLQFNIVNVILATFIFGQGDDYTIFIVEGLLYEHRTGKSILPQYKQSILLSALIMLIGIGILVIAVHPAMRSLGVLALLGMSIVLMMALTIPPMLFRVYKRFAKV